MDISMTPIPAQGEKVMPANFFDVMAWGAIVTLGTTFLLVML
jgi:hypothetical protein